MERNTHVARVFSTMWKIGKKRQRPYPAAVEERYADGVSGSPHLTDCLCHNCFIVITSPLKEESRAYFPYLKMTYNNY